MATTDTELNQIIKGCQKGRSKAQRKLYYKFYSYGLTVALHYASSREEAEEIVHDGFIKVFNKIPQYRFQGAFRGWFRRIIVHTAIDYYRKEKVYQEGARLISLNAKKTCVANEALNRLELEDAWKVLQSLTPAYRMVFNLFVLEEYTHAEIADELNISIGTSKSNLSKAKKKLRQIAPPFFHQQPNSIHG